MQVILVNGSPAAGKTSLARRIAKETSLKLITKDDLKDALVEAGVKKPNLRNWLYFEKASWQQLYDELRQAIKSKTSVIVEANFSPPEQAQLAQLLDTVQAKEIYCTCKVWTMVKRYRHRSKSGQRAKVHQNWFWYPLFLPPLVFPSLIKRHYPFFKFVDKCLVVDTEQAIDFKRVVDFVKN